MKKGILFLLLIGCMCSLDASWGRFAGIATKCIKHTKSIASSGRVGLQNRYQQFLEKRAGHNDVSLAVRDVQQAMTDVQSGMPSSSVIEGAIKQSDKAKVLQAGAAQAKYNLGGRQTSLNIDTININNTPKKGFWDAFFGFLSKGKNGRVLAAGALGGGAIGYGAGRYSGPTTVVAAEPNFNTQKFAIVSVDQLTGSKL